MASTARAWQHPRWRYDDDASEAARRSAERVAARNRTRGGVPGAATAAKEASRPERTATRPAARAEPKPVVLPGGRPRPRFLRLATLILLAGAALLAPVILNMASVGAEYEYAKLEDRQDQLVAERSSLQARRAALRSHQRVGAAAERLGLVSGLRFEYLDLGGALDDPAVADGVEPAASR